MKIRIENGCTIITTGRKSGEVLNKTGIKGLTYYPEQGRYRLSLEYKHKKYSLPFCYSIEEAGAQRQEADKQIANGTFIEWFASLPKGKGGRKKREK